MPEPVIATKKIGNQTIEITCNSFGWFTSYLKTDNGEIELASSKDFDALDKRTRQRLRDFKRQAAVHFKLSTGHTAIARRFSLKSSYDRKILCWMDDGTEKGKRFQLSTGYRGAEVFKPETPDHVFQRLKALTDKMHELEAERRTLEATRRELSGEWTFNLSQALQDALRPETDENTNPV